ncbi:MAG: DNA-processing protein DprA [Alphaproteobacteria bacterium]|nr:DNA-processing protein DprA [Alphaproteobacteria bacterium]
MRLSPPSLAGFPLIDCLRLIRSERVGPVTFFDLILQFGSPAEALERLPELSAKGGRAKPLKAYPLAGAEKELEQTRRHGAFFLKFGEDAYPPLLRQIYDPPPLLAARGKRPDLTAGKCFAIVGSRNASMNGGVLAKRIAEDLGKSGVVIASGLARGIDTQAHEGALSTGTIGVIAGGIDTIYPPENAHLFARMAEDGLILTEQPFGNEPYARAFPSRNRIIAGMSHGVLVVEATHKSGSLHTARMALQESRDVFAVPGSPLDPRCQGTNALLKQGAILTETAQDVLDHLSFERDLLSDSARQGFAAPAAAYGESELSEARKAVLQALSAVPVHQDALITRLQLPAGIVMRVVLELELAGRLDRHAGGKISLNLTSETPLPLFLETAE